MSFSYASYIILGDLAEEQALAKLHAKIVEFETAEDGSSIKERTLLMIQQSSNNQNNTSVIALLVEEKKYGPDVFPLPSTANSNNRRDFYVDGRHVYGVWIGIDKEQFVFFGEFSSPYFVLLNQSISLIVLSGLMTAIVIGGFAFYFQRRIYIDLIKIVSVVENVGNGSLSERIPELSSTSEFKEITFNVNQMISKLENLFRDTETLSQTLSHDLRNYVTHARVHIQKLKEADFNDPNSCVKLIEYADGALKTLDQVATEIARISVRNLKTGLPGGRSEQLLGPIVEQMLDLYGTTLEEDGFNVALELNSAKANVNSKLLLEVLLNLVSNALKYVQSEKRISIKSYSEGESAFIVFSDSGPGVPSEKIQSIFQFGMRLNSEDVSIGNGYGLAIAQLLTKMNGGELTVRNGEPSSQYPGLQFSLKFPSVGL
ncbi:MAG: HAMP domain-containing sensor histidine kinase [Lentilitoribacter sp.]